MVICLWRICESVLNVGISKGVTCLRNTLHVLMTFGGMVMFIFRMPNVRLLRERVVLVSTATVIRLLFVQQLGICTSCLFAKHAALISCLVHHERTRPALHIPSYRKLASICFFQANSGWFVLPSCAGMTRSARRHLMLLPGVLVQFVYHLWRMYMVLVRSYMQHSCNHMRNNIVRLQTS